MYQQTAHQAHDDVEARESNRYQDDENENEDSDDRTKELAHEWRPVVTRIVGGQGSNVKAELYFERADDRSATV